jgi:hypothetical protein
MARTDMGRLSVKSLNQIEQVEVRTTLISSSEAFLESQDDPAKSMVDPIQKSKCADKDYLGFLEPTQ